jgi:hypothetical protein
MACPVNFAQDHTETTLVSRVQSEISQLRVWHDRFIQMQGKTATGVSIMELEAIPTFIRNWANGVPEKTDSLDAQPADVLRLACEELKTFYSEAVLAQPGLHSIESVQDWFWQQTSAGKLLLELQGHLIKCGDKHLRFFAKNNLVPRRIQNLLTKSDK